jgi:hypothetical protein
MNGFVFKLIIYPYLIIWYLVPIITKVVSSNADNGEVYLIQHYVIKFVDGLRQAGGFPRVLQFPPLIKQTAMI